MYLLSGPFRPGSCSHDHHGIGLSAGIPDALIGSPHSVIFLIRQLMQQSMQESAGDLNALHEGCLANQDEKLL